MRQRLTIILTFAVIIALLALVNSLSYVKQDKGQDFEITPNRSTYHSGPTGVRALHDLLNESGYKVIRWRETPQKLLTGSGKLVKTFVVVGDIKVRFTDAEQNALLKWIAAGGHFVLIDRNPQQDGDSATTPSNWKVAVRRFEFPTIEVNPADSKQMTDKVVAFLPVQPTMLTRNVQSVLPSRYASRMNIEPAPAGTKQTDDTTPAEGTAPQEQTTSTSLAPVVH